jgi:hypothetical protein
MDDSVMGDSTMSAIPQTVQHSSASIASAMTVDVALTAPVMANDVVIVATSTAVATTIQAPTDSLGNSYQQLNMAMNPNTVQSRAAIYVATAVVSGSDTVTCHIANANNLHCHVYALRDVSSTVDASGLYLFPSADTALTVSSMAPTTVAGDYVFAYFAGNNSMPTTVTAGNGFGHIELTVSPSNDVAFSEDLIASAPGIETATGTASASDVYACLIVALLP